MAGMSGQVSSFFALLRCFKKHEWVLGRVRNVCRLARNGETTVSAYQGAKVPELVSLGKATRTLHFAALAAPETMLG
jgi:hypothetical protein